MVYNTRMPQSCNHSCVYLEAHKSFNCGETKSIMEQMHVFNFKQMHKCLQDWGLDCKFFRAQMCLYSS